MYFYWQLLTILFDDDREKKIWNYTSLCLRKGNMFLAWQISARHRGTDMAFIPDSKQGLFSLEVSIASGYMPFGLIKP